MRIKPADEILRVGKPAETVLPTQKVGGGKENEAAGEMLVAASLI
jgi:hypothetical protein